MSVELSIIIPAYNEEQFISRTLTSIERHLQSVTYEVFVVDNGSTDGTARLAGRHPQVQVISIPKGSIGAGRNTGAQRATGGLFIFLDADVEITPAWTQGVQATLREKNLHAGYIGGYSLGVPAQSSIIERAWFATLAMMKPGYLGGANLHVAPCTFQALRGFDEHLVTGEDVDFCRRAELLGLTIDFRPELRAIHLGFPPTLARFMRREAWHGIGDVQTLETFLRSRMAMAAVIFLLLGLGSVLAFVLGQPRIGLLLLCIHAAAPLLLILHKLKLRNPRYLPIQYGLGYAYLAARAWSASRRALRGLMAGTG